MSLLQHRAVVLLVGDLDSLTPILASEAVDVWGAHSLEQALVVLETLDVAVAVLDAGRPDALELAERIRATDGGPHTPLVFVTNGQGQAQILFRGFDTGPVDTVQAPVEPRVLRNKIGVYLDLWSQRCRLAESRRLREQLRKVLAHDVRSPLAVVLAGTDLLAANPTPEMAKRVVPRIHRAADRMTDMLGELLELVRAGGTQEAVELGQSPWPASASLFSDGAERGSTGRSTVNVVPSIG